MNQLFNFKSLKEFNGDLNRENLVIELEKQKTFGPFCTLYMKRT